MKITMYENMGRGVQTTSKVKAGEVVHMAEILVLSANDTKILNEQTELQYYTFKYNETQDCLVLGHGEIFNHNDQPNVSYSLVELEGRSMMQFKAIMDIEPKQQLFINYAADTEVKVAGYINSKSLIG
jgi:uncharacterized protein